MDLKDVLRQIHADRANLTHGRLPQVVFNTSTLAHQGRWGASTPSGPFACADTPEVEKARSAYIMRRICNYHYFGVPFDKGLEVLEGALAIGRQADPLGPDEVQTRMDAARASRRKPARLAASAEEKPFFSKVKSWLSMKEIEPAA